MTGRLFIALWPDDAVRARLLDAQAALAITAATRLTPAQDLHLTLHFIGAVPDERLADAAAAADVDSPPLEITFDALQSWPGGLAVLACSAVPQPLAALHAALATRLHECGLPLEARRYRPHVTLARRAPPRQPALPPLAWRCAGGHALAMRDGAHYRVLRRYGGG